MRINGSVIFLVGKFGGSENSSYLCIEIINRDTDGHRVVQSPRRLNPRFRSNSVTLSWGESSRRSFGLLLCFPRIDSRYAVLHFRFVAMLHADHHFHDTNTRTGTVHPQHAFKPFLILLFWNHLLQRAALDLPFLEFVFLLVFFLLMGEEVYSGILV